MTRDVIALLGGAVAWPLAAQAQPPTMPVIGFLSGGSSERWRHLVSAFSEGLAGSGYVEGQNVAIEYRWADGHYERLGAMVAELVARPVAVIVATGGGPRVATAVPPTIPVIASFGTDPVKAGAVASLSRPGGNITGVSLSNATLAPKRLELLRELVPNDGVNLAIVGEYDVPADRAIDLATAIVKARPDAIIVAGAAFTRTMLGAAPRIPILAIADDLVGEKAVSSLAHPGGNTTGVSILATELDGKRQELLIDVLPDLRRMAALVDPATTTPERLQALDAAARSRGIMLSLHQAARADGIVPAVEAARAAGAEALNVLASALFDVQGMELIRHTAAVRLPAIYQWPDWENGGLVAYGPRLPSAFRQLARQIIKVFRGAQPADVPVEQPDKFEFVVNVKTATALGLAIPPAILSPADEVIE